MNCLKLEAVETAVETGRWELELRAHAESCDDCGEVVVVSEQLQKAAAAGVPDHLPGAHLVWWRAELRARQEAVARVTRPVSLFERIGLPVVVSTPILVALLFWPALQNTWTSMRLYVPQSALLTTILALTFGSLILVTAVGLLILAVWADDRA